MRLGSAVVISAAIAGLTTPGCCQAIAVRVHAETTFQTITGFGSGLSTTLRWMNAIQNPRDRDRAYDLLYGAEGVRLNIVRLNISPAAQPLAAKTQGIRYD